MHVLVHAPVGSTGGYARDGQGIVHALLERGHGVSLEPTAVSIPVSPVVDELMTYPVANTMYDLEIHHVPPMGAISTYHSKQRSRKNVLWTMWEWDTFPETVPGYDRTANISKYDHVVGYTQQTLDAFNSAGLLGADQPTSVVQGGFESHLWTPPAARGDASSRRKFSRDTFKFAMVGVLAVRKNPHLVIQAFRELQTELGDAFDAELILKTDFPVISPSELRDGISIVSDPNFTDQQMKEFYWGIDCLINVSWGEGKDLPGLEATMCGVPTILNDTPGHRGWVHPSIQPLVPTTQMPMNSEYTGRFSSVEDIKKAMLDVYRSRVVAYDRAHQLASFVERTANWEARLEKLGKEIGVPL